LRLSLVRRLRGKRAVFARLLQDIEVEDEFADVLLELLDLFILQASSSLGRPQRILGPEQEPVPLSRGPDPGAGYPPLEEVSVGLYEAAGRVKWSCRSLC